jgi:hypothetical protein
VPDHTARTRWPRAWTWAIVLAVALFGAHAMTRWWGPALFGEFTSFADVPPVVAILMAGRVIVSLFAGMIIGLLISEGSNVRDRHRWQREETLRRQLWELEDQIWRDSLPDWQREVMERGRQQRAEIKREARRRLGLPEEAP